MYQRIILILAVTCLLIQCSSSHILTRGKVKPSNFYGKINFSTAKTLILVPCEFEGKTKNYIFDTGATVTGIQRDSVFGEMVTVHGASGRQLKSGSEILPSFKIDDVNFKNTFATNDDMVGLKEQMPNFGGILGRSIIYKANWMIDYPSKTIEFSDEDLSDDSFFDIQLVQDNAAPHTLVEVDGKSYDAIIDLGSVSTFNIPLDTELAKALLEQYHFEETIRERYTVGGIESITEHIGFIPLVKIGSMEFENVRANINRSSQIRLGMGLFTSCKVYIDNTNRRYRIKITD